MSKIVENAAKDLESIPEELKARMGNMDKKKPPFMNLPYVLAGYFCDKIAWPWRVSPRQDASAKMMAVMVRMEDLFSSPLPSLYPKDLLVGAGYGVVFRLIVYFKAESAKKFRHEMEYSSARWGDAKDTKPYVNPVFGNNVLLMGTEKLTMPGRLRQPKHARNKNIFVIGGSGSSGARSFVRPNLMQMHSSYVVTDPKGTVLVEYGKVFLKSNYRAKILSTINLRKSMHYNPLVYVRSEKDILRPTNTIILNTKGKGQQSGEDFWVKAGKLCYIALIGYIWHECVEEEQNFTTLFDMINASEAREDDEEFENPADLMLDELKEREPEHLAVKQYKKYKLAAGKTVKSILISYGVRLMLFDVKKLRDLTSYDELGPDMLGDEKTALFVIISDMDDTFDFIVSTIYTRLFSLLCDRADDVYHGRLSVHARCLLDELANTGRISKFEKLIAIIRSREISASIILQSKSQLKVVYKDNANTTEGNCNITLFLGGKEKIVLKEMAKILGKETTNLYNTSDTRGMSQSYGLNYQKTGKEFISQNEIVVMDGGRCIMQLRGARPFFSNKFDIMKHKQYELLSDYDEKNALDIEKYVENLCKVKVRDNDTVDEAEDVDVIET